MKTKVVFRKFKDTQDIVALFPEDVADPQGNCSSYQHVGQHGAADYNHVMKQTVHPSLEESQALKTELEGLGYDLDVKMRHRVTRAKNLFSTAENSEANFSESN